MTRRILVVGTIDQRPEDFVKRHLIPSMGGGRRPRVANYWDGPELCNDALINKGDVIIIRENIDFFCKSQRNKYFTDVYVVGQ